MFQPVVNEPYLKEAWSGSRDQVQNFTPMKYLRNG